jgi:thioesterase domain-containing protein
VDRRDLERYLHEQIPLSKAMGVKVARASAARVELSAPFAPNINHLETVFGGSASAVAILAAWALLHVRLEEAGLSSHVVIQRNTMAYERPLTGDFTAVSTFEDAATWERFLNMLKRKQRARISITARLLSRGEKTGEFEGDFVALGIHPR